MFGRTGVSSPARTETRPGTWWRRIAFTDFWRARWGLARAPDEALAQARHGYYRAFADDAGWPGHRFMPSAPWALPAPGPLDSDEAVRIRAKHLALKTEGEGQRRRIAREVRQEEPLVRAEGRTGGWAVYASPRHRMVVYVKSPCGEGGNDPAGRLFLHALWPGKEELGEPGEVFSKELLLEGVAAFWREDRDCVVARSLGRFSPIAKLRAGEWRGRPGGAVLWEAEFPFDSGERDAAATAAYRREYESVRGTPSAGAPAWELERPCSAPQHGFAQRPVRRRRSARRLLSAHVSGGSGPMRRMNSTPVGSSLTVGTVRPQRILRGYSTASAY